MPGDPLTVAQLSRLRQIFDAATEQDPHSRSAFLAEACCGDEALRTEVEQLLSAHESPNAWIDRPLLADTSASALSWTGRVIGPYQVIRQLGSGGMATVFLAERRIGHVSQRVALKMISPVLTTNEQMMRRFEHEREILASLDHPNIARFLDIGSTEDGIPYLVMDFVEGQRIDLYCDAAKLGLVERLELFCTACAAIQYAHSKGVVHRDLKPGNILITPEGSLKLLDFGIAKMLHVDDGPGTFITESGGALMTIEYASPEQVRGDLVGPRSDVYSLGVLLFELLTKRRPYRTEGRMMHSIALAICEEPPMSPSSAVSDLSADLDSILLKALRKEPEWRYASPAEFSDDIRRHIAGSRVMARDDTFRYRMERVVRRLLAPATGVFHTQGMMLFTAGLLGVGFLMERQAILSGRTREVNSVLDLSLVALWIFWAFWQGLRMTRSGRFSVLDRQSWIVFTAITAVLGTLSLISELRLVLTPEDMAIFWNAGLAMGFLIVGTQASRMLTAGGVALFASAVLASFYPQAEYFCLAGGVLLGMVLPGLALALGPAGSRLNGIASAAPAPPRHTGS